MEIDVDCTYTKQVRLLHIFGLIKGSVGVKFAVT